MLASWVLFCKSKACDISVFLSSAPSPIEHIKSERRKGYATLMLNMLLDKIQAQGCEKVLITCDEDNVGSARTIEKNKGVLYDQVPFDEVMTRRYWINLTKLC